MVEFEREVKFQRELKQMFARRPAPAGFADRVMARVAAGAEVKPVHEVSRLPVMPQPWLRWGIAAMLLVLIAGGGVAERERQERLAAMDASRKTELALRITAEKLQRVQQHIQVLESEGGER